MIEPLEKKVSKSKEILKSSIDKWKPNIGALCSFDKSSTLMIYLIKEIYEEAPVPILFINTYQQFPGIYKLKEELTKLWNLNVISTTPKKEYGEVKGDKLKCCYWLKTEPFLSTVKELNWKACITATRWDENPESPKERYVIKRKGENFYRVHPMLHWTDRDTWMFTALNDIPYCSLYDKGYHDIDCVPCIEPTEPLEPERVSEAQNKEQIIERLKKLGYF